MATRHARSGVYEGNATSLEGPSAGTHTGPVVGTAVTATSFGLNKTAVGTQAFPGAVIAAITGGESPTEAEFNSLRATVAALQAALIAVGILAAS